jgi:hypothetical protein
MPPEEFETSVPAREPHNPNPNTLHLLKSDPKFGPLDFVFRSHLIRLRVLIGNAAVK